MNDISHIEYILDYFNAWIVKFYFYNKRYEIWNYRDGYAVMGYRSGAGFTHVYKGNESANCWLTLRQATALIRLQIFL